MKRILIFTIVVLALAACAAPLVQSPEPAATDPPQVNMPNPASVNCTEQGNELEIRTAADGSQSGVCVFPDGSTCDEWAYFRGGCGPAAPNILTPTIAVEATTGGSSGGPEAGDDSGGDDPGSFMPPGATEEIADWWGVIKSTEPGAQFDDYFERQDLEQVITFGIDSMIPGVRSQIETLRDSGSVVHLYGTLFSNVMDYNGSQIQVDRIEILE
jgi:putative hemolysin